MRLRVLEPVLLRVGPLVAAGLVRCLRRTMRLRRVNDAVVHRLHREGRSYVHAIFHDQLLMMTYSYLGGPYGRRLAVLTSRHRDGEYLARTLERFGHVMVRGSTGGGAVAGLREIIRHLRSGNDGGWATDGPRGPRHRVQVGVIEAARLGRAPIVPVAFAVSKKKLCAHGTPSRCRCRSRAASPSTVSRSRFPERPIGMRWRGSASSWSRPWSA